ncbi:hypothetical protein [Undibacterium sp.]|uniref:hypothetical protein n=1 Tax=Undibacterium sp. TaxID=1914977 RepID=UPI0027308031|nr:hypothetical protein [Undibacterium sp.]MDP1977856.1 hypothetical protein [Undibacterium sp.]
MGMNDWDDLSGNPTNSADTDSSNSPTSVASSNVTPPAAVAASNSNKTMYLAMGGLMLFVMGVFGYTKYMEFQGVQNDERMQQQQAFQKSKAEAEQQKRKAEEKTAPPVAAATTANTANTAPVAEQAPAPASLPPGDDLATLAQLKNRSITNPATQTPLAVPAAVATAPVNVALSSSVAQSAPAAPMAASSQDGQKREQYVSLLEGRVNDLGLAKLRLEAELCKYEPGRGFCARSGKGVAAPEALREPVRPASRSVQSPSETTARVMLFDTAKAGNAIAADLPRTVSSGNNAMSANSPSRSQAADTAPKALSLQGLTILRDRVLYRDRDGLTHEVELGGNMENLGRLERIDFERKSFQAGGRTYN